MFEVRRCYEWEARDLQKVFSEPQNVEPLGGQIFLANLELKARQQCLAVVLDQGKVIAGCEVTRRGLARLEINTLAVSKDYVGQGHAEALYAFWVQACGLEHRVLLVDYIVGDETPMHLWLPTIGFKRSAVLRSRVRRHKDVTLYTLDLIDQVQEAQGLLDRFKDQPWRFSVESTRITEYYRQKMERWTSVYNSPTS